MGREKQEQLSTKEAKKKAVEEAAKPPPPEEPKRKLNKIRTNVHVAKVDRVVTLAAVPAAGKDGGGGKGGASTTAAAAGDWVCPACTAECFASRTECFRCKTPRPKDDGITVMPASKAPVALAAAKAAAAGSSGGGGVGGGVGGVGGGGGGAPGTSSGTSSEAAEVTIILKEWQRLPRQLLQQHTDKAKAPKPDFQLHRVRGELRGRVKLCLPKELAAPETTFDCPLAALSSQDAYQKAALYALYQLGPTIAHHRVLPDPYREIWVGWQTEPPPPPPGAPPARGRASS